MPTTNNKEQRFNFGIVNNDDRPADTTANFLVNVNNDGTYGKIDPVNLPISDDTQEVIDEIPIVSPESQRLAIASTTIVAWGDSLTAGAGGGGNTYPASLALLTNFNLIDKGIGGESSTQIKNRMVADTANYDKSVLIWAGRNNYSNPTTVKADIATMISTLTHDRYLVLGIINGNYPSEYLGGADYNTIVALNNDLKDLYGEKYVPIREFLVSLHDETTQGLLDFSRDIVPYNLRSDDIHLTSAGYTKVAEFVNQRLNILFNKKDEYLQSKDFKYYNTLFWPDTLSAKSDIVLNNGTLNRWKFRREGAEAGGTSGSNFVLSSYFDSGNLNSSPMNIIRANSHMIYKFGTGAATDRGYLFDVNGSFGAETISIITPVAETTAQPILVWNSTTKGVRTIPYATFAPTANPAFTGTPTAPTATAGTNTTQLATTAFVTGAINTDVSIQKIVDNSDKDATIDTNSNIALFSGTADNRTVSFHVADITDDNFSEMSASNTQFSFRNNATGGNSGAFFINNGLATVSQTNPGVGTTTIGIDPAIDATQIYFPALPYGAYRVSVSTIYTDATTVVKTSAELDTDYPNALPGDKVHCMDIIAGALIYEKTATGWCETMVTVVT